jgi:TatD DNase family protein
MHLDDVTLAIHGMRGNEHVARMYLDAGCYLSFGIRFNPAALRITPHDRLLIETDDSAATIDEVATAVSSALGMSDNELKEMVAANLDRLFVLS